MIKSKKQMYLIIGVFTLVMMLGTITYAFFNYTRTGSANTIKTGRIAFNSSQGESINLTNMFPIDVSEGIPNDATKVGSVTINVTGDTTYTEGVEYLVTVVNVQNTIGTGYNKKTVPISVDISIENNVSNNSVTTLGISDDEYFDNRGSTSSIYKVLFEDTIVENDQLVAGYIAPGSTGINGNIIVKAYFDSAKIAISDTYQPTEVYKLASNMSQSTKNYCEYYVDYEWTNRYLLPLSGSETTKAFCNGTGTRGGLTFNEAIIYGWFNYSALHNLESFNVVEFAYSNDTSNEWINGRTLFTTEEWNSLQQNGVSFKIKVEANEGIWVPSGKIDSCPGCKFMYSDVHLYPTWTTLDYDNIDNINVDGPSVITSGLYDRYFDVVKYSGKRFFTGVVLNENNQATNVYSCGIKDDVPFCIEGRPDGTKYYANHDLLQSEVIFNNTCETQSEYYTDPEDFYTYCVDDNASGSLYAYSYYLGDANVGVQDGDGCFVSPTGYFACR